MKPGDMVEIQGAFKSDDNDKIGVLVEKWGTENPDWWVILIGGEIIHWPECQLVLC